jgi:site-specific DNA-methyltransferase (adenine-specific)
MTIDYLQSNQPDILEVIANLSNEQVFTPPKVANAVLDLLPAEVWSDSTFRWLDPGAKTGIFPREITKRLMVGLADTILDEEARLNHILTEMIFAVATEEITGMMTRRSLYCSKDASGEFSVALFSTPEGNVWQKRVEHKYLASGRCSECGGNKTTLEKAGRDNKAYGFIHTDGHAQINKEMTMKFDVIVGNPPYQMDMGETSDIPLYDKFVEQALALNPQYVSMIIPSRWMQGGKGLDDFRSKMLADKHLVKLVDFSQMTSVFPGAVDFEGGVCYFLWDQNHNGTCSYEYHQGDEVLGPIDRDLNQFDVLIRDHRALAILDKVLELGETSLVEMVSGQTPFGLLTNFKGYRKGDKKPGDVKLYLTESGQRTEKWISSDQITRNTELMRSWKVLVPGAYGERGSLPAWVLGPTMVAGPRSVCTQTYLVIGPVKTRAEADSLDSYLQTRFARFLVSLRKISQHAWRNTYTWVPKQAWDRTWTDADLYNKYGITKDEKTYIEAMVRERTA